MKDPKDMSEKELNELNKEIISKILKSTEEIAHRMVDMGKTAPDPLTHVSTALSMVANQAGLVEGALKTMMSELFNKLSEKEEDEKYNGTFN